MTSAYDAPTGNPQYLDIDSTVYNDRSALKDAANLKSKAYQDFIHTLYRKDEDNLKKVDTLFQAPERSYYQPAVQYAPQTKQQYAPQPTYATYIAQQQAAGYQFRRKRDAAIRPLFVYRHFAEREREREEERSLRRFHQSLRRRHHECEDHEEY